MPIDKVLSVSIANAAINASAISNTANLVIGALNTGNTVVTGTLTSNAHTMTGNLSVTGNTVLTGTLTTNSHTMVGDLTVTGNQFVNGAVTIANSTSNTVIFATSGNISIGNQTVADRFSVTQNDATGPSIRLQSATANSWINQWGNTGGGSGRTNRFEINASATNMSLSGGSFISFQVGGAGDSSEKARIDTSVLSLTGLQGIKFQATQSPSSDANTLDDYEEGSYTPTLIVTSGTPSYNYATAYYTKIGRQVFGGGIIGIGNSASLGGPIRISLPFTALALSNGYTGGSSSDGSGWTYPISSGSSGNIYSVEWQINSGNAFMTFTPACVNATEIPYTATGIANGWYIRFSFSFYTS